jgi:hypothetical protein
LIKFTTLKNEDTIKNGDATQNSVHSTDNNIHANELQQDDISTLKHTIMYSGKKKI